MLQDHHDVCDTRTNIFGSFCASNHEQTSFSLRVAKRIMKNRYEMLHKYFQTCLLVYWWNIHRKTLVQVSIISTDQHLLNTTPYSYITMATFVVWGTAWELLVSWASPLSHASLLWRLPNIFFLDFITSRSNFCKIWKQIFRKLIASEKNPFVS